MKVSSSSAGAAPKHHHHKQPTDLVISSFNVLGASHTSAGGNKPQYASGAQRMQGVVKLIKQNHVDVVGFQEFQPSQAAAFKKLTDNKYGVFPGMQHGRGSSVNSIAWNKEKWDMVKAKVVHIPYFDGHKVEMPVVLLKNKETGQKAYFTNFHNPADTKQHHNQGKYRNAATRAEVRLINHLRKTSGLPVFMTGDMNEKQSYANEVTRDTSLHTALKNKHRAGIDWIFGTPDVKFDHYERIHNRAERHVSDHPMIVTHAHIRGK